MSKGDDLCKGCCNYNYNESKCNLLLSLQDISHDRESREEQQDKNSKKRSDYIEQLLFHSRCTFSKYILSFAGRFASKRALNSRESLDIHNDVVCSLLKLNFRKIQPTFSDFRRYVTKMVKSAIHQEHIKTYGPYRCGTCTFFLRSNQCGCSDLKPLPGKQFLRVSSNERPKEVVHSSMLFLEVADITDWLGFCSKLSEGGNQSIPNPSKRIWEFLSVSTRELIRNVAKANGNGKIYRLDIVKSLNDMLDSETFYQEAYFKSVEITTEAEKLFQRKHSSLSHDEVRRLNRLLLEASYPNEIIKSTKGCSYYHSTLAPPDSFVDLDNLECIEQPQSDQAESALRYMESLGPRQREQAQLIRFLLRGDTVAEIARQIGKQPNTIRKELHGRDKNEEQDSKGREIAYRQAGAFDVFQSIYNNRFFDLERKEKVLWIIVNQRDFSTEPILPPFRKIAHTFSISKREAIERYIRGWNWIKALATNGDNGMPKVKNNGGKNGTESQSPMGHIKEMSKTLHPDYYVLLNYAEGTLNLKARKLIAGHILICGYCSTELKQIETQTLPAMKRHLNLAERFRWLAARLIGRIGSTNDATNRSDEQLISIRKIVRGSRWPLPVQAAFGLAVAVLLSTLLLIKMHQSRVENQIASLTMEKKKLEEENDSLREQAQRTYSADREAQILKDKNADLEQEISELRYKTKTFEKSATSDVTPPNDPLTIIDTTGAIIVGHNVQTILPKDNSHNTNPETSAETKQIILSASQAEPVRQFATARNITSAASTHRAWQVIEEIISMKPDLVRGGSIALPSIALPSPDPISPSRTAVRSTGPTLRWKPVSGAKSYRISINDMTERDKVTIQKNSNETQITLDIGTLQPGHVYSWMVETRLDSKLITEHLITSSGAGFWVLEEKALREIEAVDQLFKPMALVRASVYSKYGLYEEALEQVEQVKRNDRPIKKIRADLYHRLGRK